MSDMFDMRHCTVILYPARSCNPYVKSPVGFPFLSLIEANDKIVLSSRALPVLYSDVWGHCINDHHSWSLPVYLIMLCTVGTLKSLSCALYWGIFKVHVQCVVRGAIKICGP
jgi:hypothetical protein